MGGKRRLLQSMLIFALLALTALCATSAVMAEDSDGDGVENDVEIVMGTDENDKTEYPNVDSDGDLYSDHDEVVVYETDPQDANDTPIGNVDSDGDGFTDITEVRAKTDPYDEKDKPTIGEKADKDDDEGRDNLVTVFAMTLIMTFAVFIIAAGAFTGYFGAGKSRGIGAALLGLGVVILIVGIYIKRYDADQTLLGLITWDVSLIQLMITVLAAFVGFISAIVLFLVAIMKS